LKLYLHIICHCLVSILACQIYLPWYNTILCKFLFAIIVICGHFVRRAAILFIICHCFWFPKKIAEQQKAKYK